MLKYRRELGTLYRTQLAPEAMRERKAAVFAAMKRDHQLLKPQWGGFTGYDRCFGDAGNAHLASVAIYNALVPQCQRMLAKHNDDLAAFYAEVKALAALGREERASRLGAVAPARQEPL